MPAPSILQQGPSPSLNSDSSAVPVLSGGLEGYEIGQAIGKGGYAIVYRGKRKSDGLLVAIKRCVKGASAACNSYSLIDQLSRALVALSLRQELASFLAHVHVGLTLLRWLQRSVIAVSRKCTFCSS